ncbi:MAG: peptide chain release factor N(5)-glutamine methyltransferase [Spirochaetales bacterium]|nr:peptide chain release factor N(5)-glutamine methyltransferase [Spirochaetales bacterium]
MTVKDALRKATSVLYYAEVETPYLDACVLLAHTLNTTKEKLFSSFEQEISAPAYKRFERVLDRRCSGKPVSYIRRRKEFYGLEFFVDERVLVPRPDTETLIETISIVLRSDPSLTTVHDLMTGSGCIAIALQHLFPELSVSASDISKQAAQVFSLNCRRLLGRLLPFYHADVFKGLTSAYDVIVSNPPYLTDSEVDNLKKIGWPEPEQALRAGPDGLDYLKAIIRSAPQHLNPGGYLFLEAASPQLKILEDFMKKLNYINSTVVKDLAGRERVIYARI